MNEWRKNEAARKEDSDSLCLLISLVEKGRFAVALVVGFVGFVEERDPFLVALASYSYLLELRE
jgi:hypothetical protein